MAAIETLFSFVNCWECDENDHLNVQFYLGRFEEADRQFRLLSGLSDAAMKYNPDSMIRWRRQKRRDLDLLPEPSVYESGACYAQPQQQDWPVYDPLIKCYVDWTEANQDWESMLDYFPLLSV